MVAPSSSPVPFLIARSMVSLGTDCARAFSTERRNLELPVMSPPPSLAATVISLSSFVKTLARLASAAPFLCLILDHLECPDIIAHRHISAPRQNTGTTYR